MKKMYKERGYKHANLVHLRTTCFYVLQELNKNDGFNCFILQLNKEIEETFKTYKMRKEEQSKKVYKTSDGNSISLHKDFGDLDSKNKKFLQTIKNQINQYLNLNLNIKESLIKSLKSFCNFQEEVSSDFNQTTSFGFSEKQCEEDLKLKSQSNEIKQLNKDSNKIKIIKEEMKEHILSPNNIIMKYAQMICKVIIDNNEIPFNSMKKFKKIYKLITNKFFK